jgi:hypothetical protein
MFAQRDTTLAVTLLSLENLENQQQVVLGDGRVFCDLRYHSFFRALASCKLSWMLTSFRRTIARPSATPSL